MDKQAAAQVSLPLAMSREVTVLNANGLHARPAAAFVSTANRFASEITVEKNGQAVSGKSILGLLTLGTLRDEVLKISAEGPDAGEALDALQNLVARHFFTE